MNKAWGSQQAKHSPPHPSEKQSKLAIIATPRCRQRKKRLDGSGVALLAKTHNATKAKTNCKQQAQKKVRQFRSQMLASSRHEVQAAKGKTNVSAQRSHLAVDNCPQLCQVLSALADSLPGATGPPSQRRSQRPGCSQQKTGCSFRISI